MTGEYLPRFHPMIHEYKGIGGWWIVDACNTNSSNRPQPHVDEPCESYEEAKELCDMLNETESDPRVERDKRNTNG